jgi:FAD/FMN-containing dehydrogenase
MARALVGKLRERVRGEVIEPADDAYEEARQVRNGMIQKRPRAIVRPGTVDDIVAAVNYARDTELDLAIRGGGHSVPGYGTCDDGIVIDMSTMRNVDVDPRTRTARVQGGAVWGDLNDAAQEHGLATTGGIISTTGVTGLTLGGGIGYLARAHGLSLDNLLAADVVIADGSIVHASAEENDDLFWALRGGGGNFGVVTSLEFQLHPVGNIVAGPILYEVDDAAALMRFYRDYIKDAPEEMGTFFGYQIAPPLPFIPEDRHGDTFALMVVCWAGEVSEADKQLAPFREAAKPVAEGVGEMPYAAINAAFDALYPVGLQHYWKAHFATELTDDAIEAHAAIGPKVPELTSTMHIYSINGACHRVGPTDTAFAHREATFATVIAGMWPNADDNEKNIEWVRDYYAATSKHSLPSGYINFMAEDDHGRLEDNYGQNFDRLVAIKGKYDPGNVFHVNQNIAPK